jgi:hypothetical protein
VQEADVVAEGCQGLEQGFGFGREVFVVDGVAVLVEDAQVQGPGVEIDAGIESVLCGVESHDGLSGLGGA